MISAYKPNGGLEARFNLHRGSPDAAWEFVREHLRHLPVFVKSDGKSGGSSRATGILVV